MKKEGSDMEESGTFCHYQGKTLGEIVAERAKKTSQELHHLQERARSQAFHTIGELLQGFLSGEIRFVSTGKVKVSGDPGKILALCEKEGLSFQEIKLKDKPLDEILAACHELIADLSYLLLKGAIVPEAAGYVPPDYKGIASVINIKDLARKFPDIAEWVAVGGLRPGETAFVPAAIVVVDVVVVIVDVVTVIFDKPIDLITRE
jgi:hypothetical protein